MLQFNGRLESSHCDWGGSILLPVNVKSLSLDFAREIHIEMVDLNVQGGKLVTP